MDDTTFEILVRSLIESPDRAPELLVALPPEAFTWASPAQPHCLLLWACGYSVEFALVMIARGAEPAPELCETCLRDFILHRMRWSSPAACAALVRDLLRAGADVNSTWRGPPILFVFCLGSVQPTSVLEALLEMPGILLDMPGARAEDVAELSGHAESAALIRLARAQQVRWSELRRVWVFAVTCVRRPPTK